MNNKEMKVLFESLSTILSNQDKIMKHLGLNRHNSEWGWQDNDTERLSNECYGIYNEYFYK